MQNYLKEMDADSGKILFSYRLRMANYGGNFRGGKGHSPCVLCFIHPDDQTDCFDCPTLVDQITDISKFVHDDIYSDNIPIQLVMIIKEITKYREEILNNRGIAMELPNSGHSAPGTCL